MTSVSRCKPWHKSVKTFFRVNADDFLYWWFWYQNFHALFGFSKISDFIFLLFCVKTEKCTESEILYSLILGDSHNGYFYLNYGYEADRCKLLVEVVGNIFLQLHGLFYNICLTYLDTKRQDITKLKNLIIQKVFITELTKTFYWSRYWRQGLEKNVDKKWSKT